MILLVAYILTMQKFKKFNKIFFKMKRNGFTLIELLVVVGGWKYKEDVMSSSTLILSNVSNTHQLGLVMYTDYILYFQLAGVVLLLAMIGAILLTFRERVGVKKQSYINQISRNPSNSIELVEAKSNQGVKVDD